MKSVPLFSFLGMPVRAKPAAFVAGALLIAVVAVVFIALLDVSPLPAVVGAVIFGLAHEFFEVWHQYGHFRAAAKTGHPMHHTTLWMLLGMSVYPRDEGSLPSNVHIRRALGGPLYSLYASIALAALTLVLYFADAGDAVWLAAIITADCFFIFTLGALTPLAWLGLETDGSTLLKWRGKS